MKIEISDIMLVGTCSVNMEKCTATTPNTVIVVWVGDPRTEINVCHACLSEKINSGEWVSPLLKKHPVFEHSIW